VKQNIFGSTVFAGFGHDFSPLPHRDHQRIERANGAREISATFNVYLGNDWTAYLVNDMGQVAETSRGGAVVTSSGADLASDGAAPDPGSSQGADGDALINHLRVTHGGAPRPPGNFARTGSQGQINAAADSASDQTHLEPAVKLDAGSTTMLASDDASAAAALATNRFLTVTANHHFAGVDPTAAASEPPYSSDPAGALTAKPDGETGITPLPGSQSFSTNGDAGGTGSGGATQDTVTVSGSGLKFNNTFESSVTASFKAAIIAAEKELAGLWTNSVTLNLDFNAANNGNNGDLASNSWTSWVYVTYAQLKAVLGSRDFLPSADPNPAGSGNPNATDWALPEAYARMLGLSTGTPTFDDTLTLNTFYQWFYGQDVINTIEHEISEGAMGRVGGLGDQNSVWSAMDLFRFTSAGAPDYSDGRDDQITYFSANGGQTLSSDDGLSFNNEDMAGQPTNGGDTADFTEQDVFGTGTPGEENVLSETDQEMMYVLGWNPAPSSQIYTVGAGQTGSNVVLNSGDQEVVTSGGTVVATYAFSGSVEVVSAGGSDNGTTIVTGGEQDVFGTAAAAVIQGGRQVVEAGGRASGTIIDTYGEQDVYGSATAVVISAMTINGARQVVEAGGAASGSMVSNGGQEVVSAGGSDMGTTIASGGDQIVSAGGLDTSTTIAGGGFQYVYGTAKATIVNNFGSQTIEVGGTASGAALHGFNSLQDVFGTAFATSTNDGFQLVEINGTASGTTIGSGGEQDVYGHAYAAVVNTSGVQHANSGGTAIGTMVNAGGRLTVEASGSASSATIKAGGYELVQAGGTTNATVINGAGAILDLVAGANATGGIKFSGSGGQLQIAGSTMPTTTISGFSSGDSIDLQTIAYSGGASVTLVNSGSVHNELQVTEGGATYELQLDPSQSFAGQYLHVTSDGSGGTLVSDTFTPGNVPGVSFTGALGSDWNAYTTTSTGQVAQTNWTGNVVPGASNDLLIGSSLSAAINGGDVNGHDDAADSVTLTSGSSLSINANLLLGNGATNNGYALVNLGSITETAGNFTLSGGTLLNNGNMTLDNGTMTLSGTYSGSGTFAQNGGTLATAETVTAGGVTSFGTVNGGVMVETGHGTLDLAGTTTFGNPSSFAYLDLDGGWTLENAGTFTWAEGTIELGFNRFTGSPLGNATIDNAAGATFDVAYAGAISNGVGTNVFDNAGTLNTNGLNGTAVIGVAFDNTGTISGTSTSGTLSLEGGGSSTGVFNIAAGAVVQFNGGDFTLSGGSGSGTGTLLIAGGEVTVGANTTLGTGFGQNGGTLDGNAKLTMSGPGSLGTVNGGVMVETGHGTLDLAGTTTFGNPSSFAYLDLDGGWTLENAGTFTWADGTIELGIDRITGSDLGDATIDNAAGGTFDVAYAGTIYNGVGANDFDNAGTLDTKWAERHRGNWRPARQHRHDQGDQRDAESGRWRQLDRQFCDLGRCGGAAQRRQFHSRRGFGERARDAADCRRRGDGRS
jgi:autotransporter passenger strand-loop-strand repeat protein